MDNMDIKDIIKENATLKRRVERMTKEVKNFVALHDKAQKLREFSEREKILQYDYNVLLLENAPDIIFILDTELRFRLGSKAFMHFLGQQDPGSLAGASFEALFSLTMPIAWVESTRSQFESVISERKRIQYNDEVNLADRKVFTMSAAPAVDSTGKIMGVICLMHDSTELVNMKEAAEAATKAKSSFLASMSHEIRTPMNAIKGFSDLLTVTPLSNQQKAYVDNIINATSGLLVIINDILDFSKIEANRYEIIRVNYNTIAELSELCDLMQPKADEKNIYFWADIDPMLPSALVGDNLRIRQILVNIINNAIKFTHKGGITFSVSGAPISADEWLITYKIRDTGQGIRDGEMSRIFQAFEQTDIYKNRNIAGTGLGLAISKNLAELMNGDIQVTSEYGLGSEFTIRIPQGASDRRTIAHIKNPQDKKVLLFTQDLAFMELMEHSFDRLGLPYDVIFGEPSSYMPDDDPPTHVLIDDSFELIENITPLFPGAQIAYLRSLSDKDLYSASSVKTLFKPILIFDIASFVNDSQKGVDDVAANGELGHLNFGDAKVLIVDDNMVNLIVASEIIKTYGIKTDTVDSGVGAVEKVEHTLYNLIFMDHMMPGMDGIEATALIRAMDIPQPVIIALTANAMLGMEEMYKKSGFDDYITKPIDIDNLSTILQKYLA